MTEHFTDGVPTEVLDTQLAEKDYQRYEDGFSEYFKMWPELISKDLNDSYWKVRKAATQMILYSPEDQRGSLVSKGLEDSNWDIRRTAAQMIQYVPEDQRGSLVSKGLEDSDWDIRRTAAQMIQYVPEDQQINLTTKLSNIISKGLEDNDWDGRVVVAQMIQYVPKSLRNPIYQNIILKEKDKLKEIAGSTPLYSDAKPGLLKQNFGKTGSETTLLLGFNLKDKAIIRTIKT